MRKHLQSLAVFLIALGTFAATAIAAQTSSSGARNDEDSIRAVMAATTDAFSRHDAEAWVKFCTPDAQLAERASFVTHEYRSRREDRAQWCFGGTSLSAK